MKSYSVCKLLVQTVNENIKLMFKKTGQFLFFKYGFRSDCLEKFWNTTSVDWKNDCPENLL